MIKHVDGSKIGITRFKKIITQGELCLTLRRAMWCEGELVGVIYVDQTGQEWMVSNDTSRIELEG